MEDWKRGIKEDKNCENWRENLPKTTFEIPFDIACSACDKIFYKGTQMKAFQQNTRNYFSTPIIEFSMRCKKCANLIAIQTDPEHCEYTPAIGCYKYVKNKGSKNSREELIDVEEVKSIEIGSEKINKEPDESVIAIEGPRIAKIHALNEKFKDDFGLNQMMRKKLRKEKKNLMHTSHKNSMRNEKNTDEMKKCSIKKRLKIMKQSIFHTVRIILCQRRMIGKRSNII
ncbi:unnamed protein product [Blepharisma stoltei]|uniref:Uncharacterized protein n=1 Tax=Blepharisma stoltei TaxID=1481888 RepID=A0AAU9J959_9CILI|nr:unnamed protein product [Blepharisma stoltei]